MLEFNAEKHEYRYKGRLVPGVTTVLNDLGLSNFDCVDPEVLERSIKFGDAVHKACEYSCLHKLHYATLPEPLKPYLAQWEKFKKDFDVEIIEIERRFFCKRYFYAGTFDRVVRMRYKGIYIYTLLDIKTGAKTISHPLQTAAYRFAVDDYKLNKESITIYLKEDKYKLVVHSDKNDINFFLSALQVYNFKRRK